MSLQQASMPLSGALPLTRRRQIAARGEWSPRPCPKLSGSSVAATDPASDPRAARGTPTGL